MDLNLLRTFAAVAETRSFSQAAKKLGLPKSSISRGIAQLEAETRTELFRRTTRQVSLSSEGAALLDRVLPSLRSLESAVGEWPDRTEEPSGQLRVTGPADLGGFLLAEVAVRFTTRYPKASVDLHFSNRLVDLVGEGFDLAVRVSPGTLKDSSLVVRKLLSLQGQLYASPTYLARRGVPRVPSDLDEHEWLIFRAAPRRLTLGGPDGFQVTPKGRIQCDDMFFAHAAIRAGAGIGFLPHWLVEADLASGALVPVLPRHASFTGTVYAVHPASKHVPAKVTAFKELLVQALLPRPAP